MAADEGSLINRRDLRAIRYLASLMSRHDLTEIALAQGTLRLRLRRGALAPAAPALVSGPAVPTATAPAPAPAAAADVIAAPTVARPLIEIKSPTPGTFYARPNPDAEPFVKVGSRVQPDTVVCLIEAMKVFNEITADCTGTVVAVLVENGQPVEYDQVLFKVDPSS